MILVAAKKKRLATMRYFSRKKQNMNVKDYSGHKQEVSKVFALDVICTVS